MMYGDLKKEQLIEMLELLPEEHINKILGVELLGNLKFYYEILVALKKT